jgi:hypothetical protein
VPDATLPTRTVEFSLDERWAGRILRFVLSGMTYTDDVQVPAYRVHARVGVDGSGEVDLFPNDLGSNPTTWGVEFPDGSRRSIEVANGVGTLDLSDLLGGGP